MLVEELNKYFKLVVFGLNKDDYRLELERWSFENGNCVV
jgi:hypothetical protein